MTKMKSKKMTKSTFAIILMAVVMIAMIAFGGTYAYFTATASKGAAFETGKVALTAGGTLTTETTGVVPQDKIITENVSFTNASTVETYVAVVFDVTYDGGVLSDGNVTQTDGAIKLSAPQIQEAFGASLTTGIASATWQQGKTNTNVYVLKGNKFIVPAAATSEQAKVFITASSEAPIKFDVKRNFVDGEWDKKVWDATANSNQGAWVAATNGALVWEDADITISITAYQVQADNVNISVDAESDVNADTVWTGMKAVLGIA